jgi:AcrR family transcriptional regulator
MTWATTADGRIERTRRALLNAFTGLIRERGYQHIKVADIAKHAEIGRSTFYEHFQSKDDLLEQSIASPLAVLADLFDGSRGPEKIEALLDHFWENRQLGLDLLSGPTRAQLSRALADLIKERLASSFAGIRGGRRVVPFHLVAACLAELQLGLVGAWLSGEASCTNLELALALRLSTTACASALLSSSRC